MKRLLIILLIGFIVVGTSVSALTLTTLNKADFTTQVSIVDSEGVCKELEKLGIIVYSLNPIGKGKRIEFEDCTTLSKPINNIEGFITQDKNGVYKVD